MTGLDLDLSQIGPIAARLGVATALGGLVGLNRHLRRHPAGLRTHAVVALGAAAVTYASSTLGGGPPDTIAAMSRTIQGILTGIGFVGAGVVLHRNDAAGVHGLTTAASIWLVAIIGIACGAGLLAPALVVCVLVFVVFTLGGPIERGFSRMLGTKDGQTDGEDGRTRRTDRRTDGR